jgi:hypothetical protein
MLQEAAAYKRKWQKAQRARLKDGCVNDSYVYVHLEEDSGEPFYVGMGYTDDRPWQTSRGRKHVNRAKKHGNRQELIIDEVPETIALWWEVRWIKALREAGYNLVNLTDGGEGVRGFKHDPEKIKIKSEKQSITMKNLYSSPRGEAIKEDIRNTIEQFLSSPQGEEWCELQKQIKDNFFASPEGDLWKEEASKRREEFIASPEGKIWCEENSQRRFDFLSTPEGQQWCENNSDKLKKFMASDEGKKWKQNRSQQWEEFLSSENAEQWCENQSKVITEAMQKPSVRWNLSLRDWHRSNVRPYPYWGA